MKPWSDLKPCPQEKQFNKTKTKTKNKKEKQKKNKSKNKNTHTHTTPCPEEVSAPATLFRTHLRVYCTPGPYF